MQLIRATPQVMGQRMDGVYNDKGILRFESQEALMDIALRLDEQVTQFDQTDKSDSDSIWYREFPILDKFEYSLGFSSVRQYLENHEKRNPNNPYSSDKEKAICPEPDPLLRTFYRLDNKIIVGNSLYHYLDEDSMIEYPLSPKGTPDGSMIKHNLVDLGTQRDSSMNKSKLDVGTSKGNDGKLEVNSCRIYMFSKDYDISLNNIIYLGTNSITNYSSYTFVLEIKEVNGVNYGTINEFQWEIWNEQRTSRLASSNSSGTAFTYNFIPATGLYYIAIKITNGMGAYNDFIKSEKWCYLPVRLLKEENNVPDKDCCLFRDNTNGSRSYNNGKNKLESEFSFHNTPLYFSVFGKVTNENSNGKKRKADSLFVSIKGIWKNINCENPNDFGKPNYNFNKKSCTVRKLNYLKRISSEEAACLGNVSMGNSTQSDTLILAKKCK